MTHSKHEQFFLSSSFAVIGNSKRKPFPMLTYGGLRSMGKTVYAVDLGGAVAVNGDAAFRSLSAIPKGVDAAVIEVPRNQTLDAVKQVADAGIKRVWLHQRTETPEALAFCRERGIDAHHGSCAVMYTGAGSYHRVHRVLAKLLRTY